MYFSLDHWKILEADPELVGPKKGRRISYSNVGCHLNNSDFAGPGQNAWVGTTPQQSLMLEPIIESIIVSGRPSSSPLSPRTTAIATRSPPSV